MRDRDVLFNSLLVLQHYCKPPAQLDSGNFYEKVTSQTDWAFRCSGCESKESFQSPFLASSAGIPVKLLKKVSQ